MFVSDWMTRNVFTLTPGNSISEAISLMKAKRIKHVPIVEEKRLKGMLTDGDIKYFIFEKGMEAGGRDFRTTLAETQVKDIMTRNVSSVQPTAPVEEVVKIMLKLKVSCVPVTVDDHLVGIITRTDAYRAFVDITGVLYGGHRLYLNVADKAGSIKEVTDVIRKYGFRLQSILTTYEGAAEGYRKIVIRTKGAGDIRGLSEEIRKDHGDIIIQEG